MHSSLPTAAGRAPARAPHAALGSAVQRGGLASACVAHHHQLSRAHSSGLAPAALRAAAGGAGPSNPHGSPRQPRPATAVASSAPQDLLSPTQEPSTSGSQGRGEGAPGGPASEGKVGVLLLNLGGPDTLDDVQPFLYNLFADPDIIRLPGPVRFLQPLIAGLVSTLRAPVSKEGYEAIGGGSPLRAITEDQAAELTASLRRKGGALADAEVYVAMRYWNPYTEEAVEALKADGCKRLVVLPLYPQFSISTSGSSLRLLEALFKGDPELQDLKHTVIPSWYQRPGYLSAMADLIEGELAKFPDPASTEIFFSAHGVPKSYVEQAGDPYKEEMQECIALIMEEVKARGNNNSHTLAYQSRVGPVEWLQPYTDESLRQLGASGCKSLLAVPISFVSEHIETLEEIDMEYREVAEEAGIANWGRVPALNTNAAFIDDLADAVVEALPYVGSMSTSTSGGSGAADSLVPIGEIEALLETYDRDRRQLPAPIPGWEWGWTRSAEAWNGRLAMIAVLGILALESMTGKSFLSTLLP